MMFDKELGHTVEDLLFSLRDGVVDLEDLSILDHDLALNGG